MPATPAPSANQADPNAIVNYCEDCGQQVDVGGGQFEFFYGNPVTDGGPPSKRAEWGPARWVCSKHKAVRVQAGHRARVPPVEEPSA